MILTSLHPLRTNTMAKTTVKLIRSLHSRASLIPPKWLRSLSVILLCTVVLFSYGCSVLPSTSPFATLAIDLGISQVDASNQPGIYEVSGNTTLPDGTTLTVSAIRNLKAINAPRGQANDTENDSYSILDRQPTTVEDGRWATTLNLWRVAPDGQYQEVWQAKESPIEEVFKPTPGVTFSVTLDPKDAATLKAAIERQDTPTLKAIEKYNIDGELYLQATKTQTVSLPFGKTLPPEETDLIRDIRVSNVKQAEVIPVDESTTGSSTAGSRSDADPSLDTYLN